MSHETNKTKIRLPKSIFFTIHIKFVKTTELNKKKSGLPLLLAEIIKLSFYKTIRY